MFQQGRRPSDTESVTSEVSDVTSRATTIPDSWSNIVLPQQKINDLDVQTIEDDRASTSLTNTASVNTVVSNKPNVQRFSNSPSNRINTQNQQQQQPWVNPYWGPNWKPNPSTAASGLSNTNIQHPSTGPGVQQLIPGSILINDRGEIDDLSYKQNTNLDSSTSNNSFNPGGAYISDDSGGPGGYLVPTHIQRRIVTSSPGVNVHAENQVNYQRSSSSSDTNTHNRPEFNRQQTFPQKTEHDIQPWVNPYWSKSNQTNSQSTQNNNSNKNVNGSQQNSQTKPSQNSTSSTNTWKNPYWNDKKPQIPSTSNQGNQPWGNPYWKDQKPQTPSASNQSNQPWENPYWKAQNSTPSKPKDQTWENPYWKDKKPQNRSISNQPWQNPYWKDKNPTNQGINNVSLNESLSFESQVPPVPSFYARIYPPASPVQTVHSKHETVLSTEQSKPTTNDNDDLPYTIDRQGIVHYRPESSSINSTNKAVNFAPQQLVPPSNQPSIASTSQTRNNTSVPQPNISSTPSFPISNNYPMSSFDYSSLLATSSSNILTEDDLNSIQHALYLITTNSNAIPAINIPNQFSSSNVSYHTNASSSFAPLFTSNQQATTFVSPFAALAARNQQQQQPSLLPQNVQFHSPSHAYNSNSQQSTIFSTPSYPLHSNELVRHFINRGPVVLI